MDKIVVTFLNNKDENTDVNNFLKDFNDMLFIMKNKYGIRRISAHNLISEDDKLHIGTLFVEPKQ